eukprot:c48229_g1_i1 orf=329-514(-)
MFQISIFKVKCKKTTCSLQGSPSSPFVGCFIAVVQGPESTHLKTVEEYYRSHKKVAVANSK